ncbi:hypothetical protein [uncultured Friedmanniella sp.]|uniref:hypothetical protein n=1 Tax=uncultured Friedmanniella sp. TaxID=335381 RepID=UPI0035CAA7C6
MDGGSSTTTVALDPTLLSLSDIALLAGVRRSSVTTWRARHARGPQAFPDPRRHVDGQERFDGDDVVRWLRLTGCGNNPEAEQDAVAFSIPAAEVASDEVLFAGLGALICLRAATGPLPVQADELVDAAETFDGDDELLFRELEAVEPARLVTLARYAELLVAGALDPAEPFDELVRRRQVATSRPPVHPALRRLIARAAVTLADEAGFADPTLVVRSVDDVGLVVAAAVRSEQRGPVTVALTVSDDDRDAADARLARRWVHVHGLAQSTIRMDADGTYELPDESVLVLRLPTGADNREKALDEVNNLCLNLSPANRALVLGPAHTLTDALIERRGPGRPSEDSTRLSPAGQHRCDAVRTNEVRAVVRLPAGLFPEQSRTRAALWCLGPSRSTPSRTLCSDLTRPLTEDVCDDLLVDLTAAMRGPASEVAHQLSTARFRPTSDLALSTSDLVAPVVREVHLGPASVMTELEASLKRLSAPVPGIPRSTVTASALPVALRRISLDQALREHKIFLVPGVRVEAADTDPRGPVPVVGHPQELDRREGLLGLSALQLATTYAHATTTLPGDVVVTTVGGPAAAVDHLGGAVVAFPARVLRCHRPRPSTEQERTLLASRGQHPPDLAPQTFTPEALAADIKAQPRTATAWKAWPLTVLPTDEVATTERLLSEVAERRRALLEALDDVDTAIVLVTQAVGSQICTLRPTPSSTPERIVL